MCDVLVGARRCLVGSWGAGNVDGQWRQDNLGETRRDSAGEHQITGRPGSKGRRTTGTRRQGHGRLRSLSTNHRSQSQRKVCSLMLMNERWEIAYNQSWSFAKALLDLCMIVCFICLVCPLNTFGSCRWKPFSEELQTTCVSSDQSVSLAAWHSG